MDLSSFSFIFIGDTHGFLNDWAKQKEIIEKTKPDYVLAEQLQDIVLDSPESFEKILREKQISPLVNFSKIEPLIVCCATRNINLIGLDLKDFGFSRRLQSIILGKKSPTREEEASIQKIVEQRQCRHKKVIKEYQKKTKKPLVIILGTWHLQKETDLMRSLNNYLVICPSNERGEMLLEPPKENEKIKYREFIKQ